MPSRRSIALAPLIALAALPLTGCILVYHEDHGLSMSRDMTEKERQEFNRMMLGLPATEPIDEIEPPTIYQEGRLRFSAQPDRATLENQIEDEGVATVINFRRESEMEERVPFDEREVVENAGAQYVHIPLGGGEDEEPGYDPEDVDRLAQVLKETEGDVLMHCASGGRARTIYTAYLIKHEGLTEEEAVRRAQRVGQPRSPLDRLLGKEGESPITEDN